MATSSPPGSRPLSERPKLGPTRGSSSYLTDRQQYRPPQPKLLPRLPPQDHPGIDSIVEDDHPRSPLKSKSFTGIASAQSIIVESGLDHSLLHSNCIPPVGERRARLIATLFYKHTPNALLKPVASSGTHGRSNQDHAPADSTAQAIESAAESIPQNLAPTDSLDVFPLEPPADSEPEQLDHLYGSFVSPFCITSFLSLMSTFPPPYGDAELNSSHRCLDDPHHPLVVELTLDPAPSTDYLSLADLRRHELIYRFERQWNVDVVLQQDQPWRRYPRLVVFDMDSTLIAQEVIDLLATHVKDPPDLASRVATITRRAMAGELDFALALRERAKLLRGLPVSVLTDLRSSLQVTPGVRELIRALRRMGVKTAVLSGGFQPLTHWLASELNIDHAYANQLITNSDGLWTGEVADPIVDRSRKRDLFLEIAAKEGVPIAQTLAVGDGANDLDMMKAAGLGVAWHAKPMVQLEADARLNRDSMLDLLYFFGLTSEEILMLSNE